MSHGAQPVSRRRPRGLGRLAPHDLMTNAISVSWPHSAEGRLISVTGIVENVTCRHFPGQKGNDTVSLSCERGHHGECATGRGTCVSTRWVSPAPRGNVPLRELTEPKTILNKSCSSPIERLNKAGNGCEISSINVEEKVTYIPEKFSKISQGSNTEVRWPRWLQLDYAACGLIWGWKGCFEGKRQ